jgi:hypothetical protein
MCLKCFRFVWPVKIRTYEDLYRLALQRRMIAENPCADVVELDTDHTPRLSMTGELAQALHRFATHPFPLTA